MDTGYSGTPLIKKIGIKPGHTIHIVNPIDGIRAALGPLPEGARDCNARANALDVALFFVARRAELEHGFAYLAMRVVDNGMIWICWPKKASKLPTDITEDVLREVLLPTGWVDVKVCAIDAQWSGLKFVRRLENRQRAVRTRS